MFILYECGIRGGSFCKSSSCFYLLHSTLRTAFSKYIVVGFGKMKVFCYTNTRDVLSDSLEQYLQAECLCK